LLHPFQLDVTAMSPNHKIRKTSYERNMDEMWLLASEILKVGATTKK
jgi:hypothetical protein